MDGWKGGRMDRWKDGRMEGWKDGWMEGWKDGRMEGWKEGGMEGWKDGRMFSLVFSKVESTGFPLCCIVSLIVLHDVRLFFVIHWFCLVI